MLKLKHIEKFNKLDLEASKQTKEIKAQIWDQSPASFSDFEMENALNRINATDYLCMQFCHTIAIQNELRFKKFLKKLE